MKIHGTYLVRRELEMEQTGHGKYDDNVKMFTKGFPLNRNNIKISVTHIMMIFLTVSFRCVLSELKNEN